MISTLPLELFDLVIQHLHTQDKYNCLFVCQAWYPVFRLALYQNCVLTTPQAYRSFHATLKNSQGPCLGGQVRLLDTSHCELSLEDLKSLFQLCPNVRGSKFRWQVSYLEKGDSENHDQWLLAQTQTTDCQQQRMWDHQPVFPVWPAADTNVADHHRHHQQQKHKQLPPTFPRSLSLCDSLTQLTLHGADMVGLFSVVTHLPLLEQLYLFSAKLDMTIYDLERIHAACPHLSSLSMELHTLLSTSQPNFSNDNIDKTSFGDINSTPTVDSMRYLKLVYKKLEKPGRSPWIHYMAHKYPTLTSLELKSRFVQRQHYWQWNENISMDDIHGQHLQQQQHDDWENMECHPEFRYGLQQWARSCHHLTRIHFTGIPWDQWFLKHLPAPMKKVTDGYDYGHYQQQQAYPTSTIGHRVQHIHVVRVDDNFNAAAATFWTLVNHSALKQLSHLTLRPVSPLPDISFYKALGQLDSLVSLTIHQQGNRSSKFLPCQLDIHQVLIHCRKLETLDLGGLALSTLNDNVDQNQQQQQQTQLCLRSLSLSTTNISHSILQRVLQLCPSLTRLYFISCEYDASLEYGIPTLTIEHPNIHWKEIHIRYPLIQSPLMAQYHQPMGLSGSRRRGGTPRYLTISQHRQDDQWVYLDANEQEQQRKLDAYAISTIIDDQQQQKDVALRKPGLELGRIKVSCHSIGSLYINGTRIHL